MRSVSAKMVDYNFGGVSSPKSTVLYRCKRPAKINLSVTQDYTAYNNWGCDVAS